MNVLDKLRRTLVFNPDYPKPPFTEGERIVREGKAAVTKGYGGARLGALILTNRRLIWYETVRPWPLKRICGELNLSDVLCVDKGNALKFLFGGMCIQLRLRSGKVEAIYEADGKLDDWIAAIKLAIASVA